MKNLLCLLISLFPFITFSQSYQLKLIQTENKKEVTVKEGDKILLAVKTARHQIDKKSSDAYLLSKLELNDSVYMVTKGKVLSINDSTIVIRERNSLFSATDREIRIKKINTIRKLTLGNQLFRTVATVGGGLAFGVMVFYSYVKAGGCRDCLAGMFKAAGTGIIVTRFGQTKIAKKHLNKWKIEIVRVISDPKW